jgi:Ca2+-binding RTX toxin-like protein
MANQVPITNSGPIAIGSGEFAYIGVGIQVSGTTGQAVDAINGRVINEGTIAGLNGVGLGTGSVLINLESGRIFGDLSGAGGLFQATNLTYDNRGTIHGSLLGVWCGQSVNSVVINSGRIETGYRQINDPSGLVVNACITGGIGTTTIINSGTVDPGLAAGLAINGPVATGIEIVTNTGTVSGKISLGGGNDTLNTASGRVSGVIDMGAGTDKVFGTAFRDTVLGGSGNDILIGNAGSDQLRGDAGVDTLNGGLGNDILSGGSESDTLIGGAGIDTLTGSASSDFFVFNAGVVATNRDLITDFANITGNNDTFRLENAVMPKVGAPGALNPAFFHAGSAALDANDFIVYNKTTGALFYDFNGNATGGAVQLATLTNKPTLFASDFVVI